MRMTTRDGRTAAYDPRASRGVQVFARSLALSHRTNASSSACPTGNSASPMGSSRRSARSIRLVETPRSGSAVSGNRR